MSMCYISLVINIVICGIVLEFVGKKLLYIISLCICIVWMVEGGL